MVLTIVGLGLADLEDITLKGLKAIQKADFVYLEIYTSMLIDSSKQELESFYQKSIIDADRISIEEQNQTMLNQSIDKNVVLLVAGDPLSATTHSDLCLEAIERGIQLKVIHNASILNAVAICGLQLYRFGETVSIPFFEMNWKPDSFFTKIMQNQRQNLHTLCLLDIKVKERSVENLMANKLIFEPPRCVEIHRSCHKLRFMNVATAIGQLLSVATPDFGKD
ncbi:bifunctional Tetrapyrrole methylase [Babesia duncani]|uniref:diphthine methyl ester synthase n=1 Tax=Babesia duncani TaxID=323732 RepID=A0AAD9PJF2_9APIC|nr:bifunctional Tetrapyrrole methylase [Babesia duncani]